MGKKRRRAARRPAPVWKLVVTDLLLFAVALNVFALFHHVLPRRGAAVGLTSQRVSTAVRPTTAPASLKSAVSTESPMPTAMLEANVLSAPSESEVWLPEASEPGVGATPTPEPTSEPMSEPEDSPTPEPVGYFGSRFADKFTDGEVEITDSGYRSANINIHISREIYCKSRCFIADIYIRDISCFQSILARETYGRGYAEHPKRMAQRVGSVLLINGDFYGTHDNGVVIRNGTLYRDDPHTEWDVGVLYWDGTMETFSPRDFDAVAEMERGAYQAWNFGPLLLDSEGKPMEKFNTRVGGYCNPRTALGYYEPGHYCFVVVDGRSSRSRGMTMSELSEMMYQIGCKRAYNLDGGQSSAMVALTSVVNSPYRGGRSVSDALVIMEPKEEK